jgi:hypothetical protein
MTMYRSAIVSASLAVLGAAANSATLTDDNIDYRQTLYQIPFTNLSFAGAINVRWDELHFHGNVGDSGTFGIPGFAPGSSDVSIEPAAGMAVDDVQPANASGVVLYTATIVGSTDQSLKESWIDGAKVTTGLTPGGLAFLEFDAADSGFLRAGGQFDFVVAFPGDWSHLGKTTGSAELLGVNPEFTIIQNFNYDSAANYTMFEAVDSNYGLDSTDVRFILYGAPIPEPSTFALMLAAIVPLPAAARRRKRSEGVGS